MGRPAIPLYLSLSFIGVAPCSRPDETAKSMEVGRIPERRKRSLHFARSVYPVSPLVLWRKRRHCKPRTSPKSRLLSSAAATVSSMTRLHHQSSLARPLLHMQRRECRMEVQRTYTNHIWKYETVKNSPIGPPLTVPGRFTQAANWVPQSELQISPPAQAAQKRWAVLIDETLARLILNTGREDDDSKLVSWQRGAEEKNIKLPGIFRFRELGWLAVNSVLLEVLIMFMRKQFPELRLQMREIISFW